MHTTIHITNIDNGKQNVFDMVIYEREKLKKGKILWWFTTNPQGNKSTKQNESLRV